MALSRFVPLTLLAIIGTLASGTAMAGGGTAAFSSVISLSADQPTVLARTGDRVIAWQPDVEHGRIVQLLGNDATRTLTVGLGPAGVGADGRANFEIKALAPLPGGDVMLYVAALGRGDVGGLWRWKPGPEPARRVLTDADVAGASGFGTLLALAEVQMTPAGDDVWVLLRNPEGLAFCRLDAGRLATAPRLARPFDRVNAGGAAMAVERQDVWTGRPDGTLTLFRPRTGEAWHVDAAGAAVSLDATPVGGGDNAPPIGRTTPTAPPLDVPTPTGRRPLWFFPDAARFAPAPAGPVRFPALVLGGKTETVIGRDAIDVRPGFPTHGLRLTAWCVGPGGGVLAYDAMSGEVFRLTLATD